MELINHGDVTDKDLVNQYGGVAYDHESLPKVVAVHTWTTETPNSTVKQGETPNLSSLDQSPSKICYSMKIGIRSSLKRYTHYKDNSGVKSAKVSN